MCYYSPLKYAETDVIRAPIFQHLRKCRIPSINTQKGNKTNFHKDRKEYKVQRSEKKHGKERKLDTEEKGGREKTSPPLSSLEEEMFLPLAASGGSNSRLFVVPPLCAPDAPCAMQWLRKVRTGSMPMLGSFAIPEKHIFLKLLRETVMTKGGTEVVWPKRMQAQNLPLHQRKRLQQMSRRNSRSRRWNWKRPNLKLQKQS